MECVQFEAELQRRQDSRLALASPDLEVHAAECSVCRSQLMEAMLLEFGVAAWLRRPQAASADFTERLVVQIRLLQGESRTIEPLGPTPSLNAPVSLQRLPVIEETPRAWQGWAVLAGTFAAMWLVFAGGIVERPKSIALRPDRQPISPAHRQPAADFGTVLASAQGAYSHMANDSLAAARDLALLWPTTGDANTVPASTDQPGSATDSWDSELSKDLAPIGSSLEGALNFLKRTVPQSTKTST